MNAKLAKVKIIENVDNQYFIIVKTYVKMKYVNVMKISEYLLIAKRYLTESAVTNGSLKVLIKISL